MPLRALFIQALCLVLLTSCHGELPGHRRQNRAPKTVQELGWIVRGASAEQLESYLSAKPERRFRPLNHKRGLIEVFHATPSEVSQHFPSSTITRNTLVAPVFMNEVLNQKPEITPPPPQDPLPAAPLVLPTPPSLEIFTHIVDLKLDQVWPQSRGENVCVAVLDSGVDYNHPYLHSQIQINTGEIPDNGLDDDNNGLVDDVWGWDFVDGDNLPYDDLGHGTHVAGLIAGRYSGVAPEAKILAIRTGSKEGGDLASLVASIYYAIDRHCPILNISLGQEFPDHSELTLAVDAAQLKGHLIVAAAGNGHDELGLGMNLDRTPVYPAALPHANVITVAASDPFNLIAPYSNFGKRTVDMVAFGGLGPDHLVWSAGKNPPSENWISGKSGTSMAAPQVSGALALLMGGSLHLTSLQAHDQLLNRCTVEADLIPYTTHGCRLNVVETIRAASAPVLIGK